MPKLRDQTVILTDWSGVMSDDRKPVYEANMRVVERHGINRVSFEEWLVRSQVSAVNLFIHMGVRANRDALSGEYAETLAQVRREGIHPVMYPDAKTFIESVTKNGKKIIVVSTHPSEHLIQEAKEYGLFSYVSEFFGSTKDKVQAIRNVCDEWKLLHSSLPYLGDTIYDVRAAKEAGAISIAIATGYHTKDRLAAEKPDILVESLTELLEYFR